MEEINERLDNLIWLMNEIDNTYVKNELYEIKNILERLDNDNKKNITQIKEILCENN